MKYKRTTLRRLLKEQGISMYKLAKRAGISASTARVVVLGLNDTTLSLARKIAKVLGLSIDAVFPE